MPDVRTEAPRADQPNPGSIVPPDLNMASAVELATSIRADALGQEAPQDFGLVHVGAPLPSFLRDVDVDRDRYEQLRPGREVLGLGLPALGAWQAADDMVTLCHDAAHDGVGGVQVAARNDELAAIDSVTNGTKLAAATRPAAEAKAVNDARLYRAALDVAFTKLGDVRDALREHWSAGTWRARAIADIGEAQAAALRSRDDFAQSLARLHGARTTLLSMDRAFGTAEPGALLMADVSDPRVRLSPPTWHGLAVAQVLAGQAGSMNRAALNVGSLAEAERFILADLVNEHVVIEGGATGAA